MKKALFSVALFLLMNIAASAEMIKIAEFGHRFNLTSNKHFEQVAFKFQVGHGSVQTVFVDSDSIGSSFVIDRTNSDANSWNNLLYSIICDDNYPFVFEITNHVAAVSYGVAKSNILIPEKYWRPTFSGIVYEDFLNDIQIDEFKYTLDDVDFINNDDKTTVNGRYSLEFWGDNIKEEYFAPVFEVPECSSLLLLLIGGLFLFKRN